jgi:Methyltransferase domain
MRLFLKISIFCFFFNFSSWALDDLSILATKYETDKAPNYHNYTPIYHNYFKSFRNERIKFLEIGFFKGSSARMWEQYFQNGELHFIEIHKDLVEKYGNGFSHRCHLHIVNQGDVGQLKNFLQIVGGNFDIIIDDGGHTMKQQITSFETLFPAVKSGGIYVIEDLHTSYWKEFGGYGSTSVPKAGIGTTIQFIKDRLDDINYIAACTGKASRENCPHELLNKLSYYQKYIDSVHFYSGIIFIFKR